MVVLAYAFGTIPTWRIDSKSKVCVCVCVHVLCVYVGSRGLEFRVWGLGFRV